VLTGDLGSSFLSGQPVALILGRAIPITVEPALVAAAFAILVGVPLGVIPPSNPILDWTLSPELVV
jgi:peptide/nickel transport system permease protein